MGAGVSALDFPGILAFRSELPPIQTEVPDHLFLVSSWRRTVADKHDLKDWVAEALRARGGSARLVSVAKYIWQHHEEELRASGDLFYTWQYDMRWGATLLRKEGTMKPAALSSKGWWELDPRRGKLG
jgi:hypothetical protein